MGIIGDPVAHSLSPRLHNAAFAADGVDMVYVPLPVKAGDVGAAAAGLPALGFRGANVTVPHKGAVIPYLDRLDDDARLAMAVNTIVIDGGRSCGYNTDIAGARAAIEEACDAGALRGEQALLLGAGGAARGVALALARLGLQLTIVNRTLDAAERLATLVSDAVPGSTCEVVPWAELTPALVAGSRMVVNATSLGMTAAGKVPVVLADNVIAGQVVFDVVYSDGRTDLLAQAETRGASIVDGLGMLIHQAAEAYRLWTGRPAPLEVMRDAVEGR